MSTSDKIADYLKAGHTLTPLEALEKFQCLSLSQRCGELKKRGLPIETEMVEVGKKRVARYRLRVREGLFD